MNAKMVIESVQKRNRVISKVTPGCLSYCETHIYSRKRLMAKQQEAVCFWGR